jgi:hypothetical protein
VIVALKLTVRLSVGTLLLFVEELPDDERLVARSGDEDWGVFVFLLRVACDY